MDLNSIPAPFGGPIEIGLIDEKTRLWTPLQIKKHNLILYGAANILGQVMAGNTEYIPNTVYFEFSNGVYTPPANTDKAITTSYYTGLSAPADYMRVSIDSSPALSASSGSYSTNVVTYLAAVSAGVGVNGRVFDDSNPSVVYGGALVSSPTNLVGSDIVYSRFYFDAPVTFSTGSLLGVKWSMQFSS